MVVLRLLIAAALVALAGAAVYFAHVSQSNRHAADAWRARATQVEHLLSARTAQLSQRDAALNRTAGELATLGGQVSTLESRQRSLVNEKAQVEDQRGLIETQAVALARLAGEERSCNSDLNQLLDQYAAGNFVWVTANAGNVEATCQQADAGFSAFQARYGGQ